MFVTFQGGNERTPRLWGHIGDFCTFSRGVVVVREPDPDAAGLIAQGGHHHHHHHHHPNHNHYPHHNYHHHYHHHHLSRICGANLIAMEWAFRREGFKEMVDKITSVKTKRGIKEACAAILLLWPRAIQS